MDHYVLDLRDVDKTQVATAGGKGALLGELSRIEGIGVPGGFCVTSDAFRRALAQAPSIQERLERLSRLEVDERDAIAALSAEIRGAVEASAMPEDVASAISDALARHGEQRAYAVRSSATAEDLPSASFAGQHDTYLNVVGSGAVLQHVSRCWASLFSERAVTYRLRNGFDQRKVQMAVVVQQILVPHAAGVLFTADPVTSNRKVLSIEAGFGLGEAVVSGLVNADIYKVRGREILAKTIAAKQLAVHALPSGGTQERQLDPERQAQPALSDAQVLQLAQLGRQIEAHFGAPQDVEWCVVDDSFHVLQRRPITTLFPIPQVDDGANHVYLSVGHQQMMTDAMKPLGLSMWQLTARPKMHIAGGRLFVDATPRLRSPARRAGFLELVGKSDPLTHDALQSILERGDFIPSLPDDAPAEPLPGGAPGAIETDPNIVSELIEGSEASITACRHEIVTKSGPALFDFILADLQELKRILFDPRSHQVFMTAMQASWWLNEHLQAWLGETNAADTLTRSVPHNITSEMGLALLDVADAIRPHPTVVAFLRHVEDDDFLEQMSELAGGPQARDAIRAYLERYGMRCVGEIDITRTRWSERPTTLLPMILANVENFERGAGERHFEQGRLEAREREHELLARLRALPGGELKAEETKRMIDRVRTFIGYREYPKYGMVSRYFLYKQALLKEAQRLVRASVLAQQEDSFYLTFHELHEAARTNEVDKQLIDARREAFRSYQALSPPRVLTSDGESLSGSYRRGDLPVGALAGLAVSAGSIEGRARVILDMAEADLEVGDILVTAYTDPSWAPLFVAVKGLVTEVGGLMTHGAVIAREYGLPAVVGVERATKLIHDGQRIRVHGTQGYVEILK
jgi:rifampicin phosphotransferase